MIESPGVHTWVSGDFLSCDFVIYSRFVSLRVLMFASDMVDMALFEKPCARLVEAEGDAALDTLPANVEHPLIIAWPRLCARLSADGDLLNIGA